VTSPVEPSARSPSAGRVDLAERFRRFAAAECRGSSLLYERLSLAIATDDRVLSLMAEAPIRQRRPNLLFAAVHDLLLSGEGGELRRFYPSLPDGGDAHAGDPWPPFRAFCISHHARLAGLLRARATQTNEPRRSALLLPALGIASRRSRDRPMAMVDIGASAGLNLLFDAYGYDYGAGRATGPAESIVRIACELRGRHRPPIPTAFPEVAHRVGLDRRPLDVSDEDDVRWLRACVWPEHRLRRRLLDAAIEIARPLPPRVVRGDAVDMLPVLADEVPPRMPLCVLHTATLTYFSEPERAAFADVVGRLARTRSVVWIALEGHGSSPASGVIRPDEVRPGAGVLSFTAFPGGERRDHLLAYADMHGGWMEWIAGDGGP
jgi:hypothetical protein